MQNPTHFCANCGSPLEPGARFCEACGTPVKSAAAVPPAPQAPAQDYNQARPRSTPPAAPPVYYQAPPPPPTHYQPPAPRPPAQYAPPPRRKTPTGLIIGGVIVGLLVCCGLGVLVISLAGGAGLWNQITGLGQNPPAGIVAQDTAVPAVTDEFDSTVAAADTAIPPELAEQDTPVPAETFPPATDVPEVVVQPTLTSQPAPNEVQDTPVLPNPQGNLLEFTDDLMTNGNLWPVDTQTSGPRTGFYPSAYYIDTDKQQGEYMALIPKINAGQSGVKDFEIDFYGLQWSGDGYLGLDFHYVDNQNYYQAAVKDGKFLIRKKINGQFLNLTQGGWIPSNSFLGGPNKITVLVHGDVIVMKVNDDLMAQLKDDSLPEGQVRLTAGVLPEAPDGTAFEGRFNNFHVSWYVQP